MKKNAPVLLPPEKRNYYQYGGRRKDDFFDYIVMVEFTQYEDRRNAEKEWKGKFVFTGLKCHYKIDEYNYSETERLIGYILNLIENDAFSEELKEEENKHLTVKFYLHENSHYLKGLILKSGKQETSCTLI